MLEKIMFAAHSTLREGYVILRVSYIHFPQGPSD